MNAEKHKPVDCAAERLCIAFSVGPNCGIRVKRNRAPTPVARRCRKIGLNDLNFLNGLN